MAEIKREIQLEIGHVLFVDIVGYSKLLINEQRALLDTSSKSFGTRMNFAVPKQQGADLDFHRRWNGVGFLQQPRITGGMRYRLAGRSKSTRNCSSGWGA